MPHKKAATIVAIGLMLGVAHAGISPDEAARLGKDLTPLGAEKAANADGTIPAWEGGIKSAEDAGAPGFKTGGHHPDPFSGDQVQFTINAQNMDQYADKLTAGHKALLKTYGDTYFMNVYPTRRSAAYPQRIYDATKRNAVSAELIEGGNGVTGATESVPFPIPSSGIEVIWNHILRFRGEGASRTIGQAPVTRSGDYTMVMLEDEFYPAYSMPGAKEEELENVIIYFKQRVTAPPRLAGQILLVHETLNQALEHRKAWLYNPGQRRVRRAPNVAFDNPGTASDGLRTSDDLDMYNGSPERYNWELVGKREIYVPYNAYKLHSDKLKYSDIIRPLHINQEHPRYELHRVWVVNATLKDGIRHVYKRRTFYIDEDSWQILVEDIYDNRDQIWRVAEGHAINYYDVPTLWTTLDVYTDLQVGRYLALGLNNEQNKAYDFDVELKSTGFSPSALRRAGTR
ncbi:MAG: DUF1329 domain-containing protein [Gammaproteobacteria bacterium]|nr:DUF1329 domain-containing protein [Gammaproteobacteria bacterium]